MTMTSQNTKSGGTSTDLADDQLEQVQGGINGNSPGRVAKKLDTDTVMFPAGTGGLDMPGEDKLFPAGTGGLDLKRK